jgi:hypothetical protein
MSIKVITRETLKSGDEPLIESAIRYLEQRGIDPGSVRKIVITAEVGQLLELEVSLRVSPQLEPEASLYIAPQLAEDVLPTVGPSDHWGEQ